MSKNQIPIARPSTAQPTNANWKLNWLVCFVVISVTVVGYFVGLQSPMNPPSSTIQGTVQAAALTDDSAELDPATSSGTYVVPATHYADMWRTTLDRAKTWQTSLIGFESKTDLLSEITITPEQKSFAISLREQNRSFNGAPPTIPHPVEQMSTQSCMACHGQGVKTQSLSISKMSHQFLENCTQCHVESNPQHMPAALFGESSFVGMPTPTGGSRAFKDAPPMIPHSTWMRVDCMSCHGPTGKHGIRSTHPWRTSCLQCHAPSSQLDQIELDSTPHFLPPLNIKN